MRAGPTYRTATGSSGRRPWLGLIAAGALVAVAFLKPWGVDVPFVEAPSPAPTVVAAAPTSSAVTVPAPETAAELAVRSCPGRLHWMVHSFQRRGDDLYNIWTVTEPMAVASADLATLIYTPIYASEVMAFGYCAPGDDELRPRAGDIVTIWRVSPDGRTRERVPAVSMAPELRVDYGALMGPESVRTSGLEPQTWAPGKYLVRVGGVVLGAEVVIQQPVA